MITDIYAGPGLDGVARGTVKALRVYRYEYGPRLKGGHNRMGMEAGWDAKQVLGTAPVEPDGSCRFKVPANTPFAMQPLDKDGCALQLMRSWTVAMPGEMLSCVGCHESASMPPPMKRATVMLRKPSTLEPFHGPVRGFSFRNEVQPVLQKHCVSCHNGSKSFDSNGRDRQGRFIVPDRVIGTGKNRGKKLRDCGLPDFSDATKAYTFLHPYVRRNGPEGDYHLLTPLEFHIDTSELFQMLRKGHHGVKLDKPAWDRLVTWADLNAPFKGSWTEAGAKPAILARRMYLRKLYADDDYNPEKVIPVGYTPGEPFVTPPPRQKPIAGKPVQVSEIEKRTHKVDLGDGVAIDLTLIPAGSFSMGSNDESPMEQPVNRVQIAEPFYMATKEVTLEQYRRFDPDYLNGVYDMQMKDQIHRGYYMNVMKYPVIRVSWQKANEFCQWLSKKTGKDVKLPTEAQWEWAARAGGDAALSYGDVNADFSKHANLADVSLKLLAVRKSPDFELQDPRYNDGVLHLAEVGKYRPNAFGLYDMHGNVAEWTRSDYKAYPYNESDGRNAGKKGVKKVVRGGSWHDRPCRSTSSYRLGFPGWQRVYDVGFRVVIE
jgi:formylglycine-generating enzyme required for sulfatase activity